ncbi:MAG: hypothetical protein WA140_07870 [Geobacteraceae bacterium]
MQREALAGDNGATVGKAGPLQAKEQKGGGQCRTIREKERKSAIRVNSLAEVAEAGSDAVGSNKAVTGWIPANFMRHRRACVSLALRPC